MENKFLTKIFGDFSKKEVKKLQKPLKRVLELEKTYSKMSDEELSNQTFVLKERLSNGETLDDIMCDAFAVCREASWRVLNMKHYPVQIIGGMILHQGQIAEMKTGEGKTLVETLPVYLNALSGEGVHVVTVNDYLAKRDSQWMGRIYKFLNLSVGLVLNESNSIERKHAYKCDVTYATNNELGFDYLRDNMIVYKEERVQRGHAFAIIDEIDSILIDEARTPLIISGVGDDSSELYEKVNSFVRKLSCSKVKDIDTKVEIEETVDGDYIVNEKEKSATLTKQGIKKAEKHFNIDNLMDIENSTLRHYIEASIKAHGVMNKDVDYVVKDGKVKIVDEFTGRIMEGRRYNQGLHQAIEAKEGVIVNSESKTLASITFQNYFRLYKKLAGMTGTALTEKEEFSKIYNLDVVEVPTNKPVIRKDEDDVIYFDEETKFKHVVEQIIACHEKGQPILVGTVNIEKSELVSSLLKKKGIKHNVLNAKNHEKEAHIIAQAGRLGMVTIATNMAGRGTDIMLGGNAEYLAEEEISRLQKKHEEMLEENPDAILPEIDEKLILQKYEASCAANRAKVIEAGGLYVLGTERHESRRIDNQLRGRSGRQGDPGTSKFFISLEDDLMRLFGGESIQRKMNVFYQQEDLKDYPIEFKFITKSIERAQKNIEGVHYQARKNTLQFDDVVNAQRKIIYTQRNDVLDQENTTEVVLKMFDSIFDEAKENAIINNDINILITAFDYTGLTAKDKDVPIAEFAKDYYTTLHNFLLRKQETLTPSVFEEMSQYLLLKNVDKNWMDYIDEIEDLKQGIHLMGYAQKDPVVAFRVESYDMFEALVREIKENTVRDIFLCVPAQPASIEREVSPSLKNTSNSVPKENISPNAPCPCGSGKKYKKCCGLNN